MSTARALFAAMFVLAILLVSRPASPSCDNPGGSEGFDDCTQHPNCQCLSESIVCPKGAWYTQYYVDLGNCAGSTPKPSVGSGAGSGSGSKGISPECQRMQDLIDAYNKILEAFENEDLLNVAISQDWAPSLYDAMVGRSSHQTGLPPSRSAVMWTNPHDCTVHDVRRGCDWLRQHGLPVAACIYAIAHEMVHVGQCLHKPSDFDSMDLRQHRDREVEALQQTIANLKKFMQDNCHS